jgi:hypothetical protein
MTTTTKAISALACAPGALTGGPVRTRFFDGMFLTQADLETEQRYWRIKRKLTNRALGAGVVWGLRLSWNADRRAFTLSPGYALDCCGNDLVVECQTQASATELWQRADPSLKAAGNVLTTHAEVSQTREACIVLQYTECGEEPRMVQSDACSPPGSGCELSRVRETARLMFVPPPAKRPNPIDEFLDDLHTFHANLPSQLAGVVFPPQPPPTSSTVTSGPPITLSVRAQDGLGSAGDLLAFPAPGATTAGATITAMQSSPTTAVVTFELKPLTGWGFTAGVVTDQGRTVETVTPPSAPSMFWSLDVVWPANVSPQPQQITTEFTYIVKDLAVAQTFGGTQNGVVNAEIKGFLRVTSANGALRVIVERLSVRTLDATVGTITTNGHGCFDALIPWGWAADGDDGSMTARVLVISAWYAFLGELATKNVNPALKLGAQYAYQLLWYALFDANAAADPSGKVIVDLSKLIQKLFERWCNGFAYPGPRCTDEHHGVYLGCCSLDRSGNVISFDMWTHRRYVITGPLLAHWGSELGVAPIDVIVGRFADALCCVAHKPLPALAQPSRGPVILGPGVGTSNIHVGTTASVDEFAAGNHAKVRYVAFPELAKGAFRSFTAKDTGEHEVIAYQVPQGATIGLLVPVGKAMVGQPDRKRLVDEVTGILRAPGETRVRERSRPLVAGFISDVLSTAPVSALVSEGSSANVIELAKLLDASHTTIEDLVVGGTAAITAHLGGPPPANAAGGADDLVDRAELSLVPTATHVVKVVGSSPEPATFKDPGKQQQLAKALTAVIPKLSSKIVIAAANKAASS